MDFVLILAKEFNLRADQVKAVIELIDAGNTIPFIARYRKEMTGSLDDQILRELSERLTYLRGLEKRREEISRSITDQGMMTEEIALQLNQAVTLAELEDIYRPFKPKRRTRAMIARERGLEPLAILLQMQQPSTVPLCHLAAEYMNDQVPDADAALQGARDILAEGISDDAALRKSIRELCRREGIVRTAAAKEEDSVYRMYYDYQESVLRMPPTPTMYAMCVIGSICPRFRMRRSSSTMRAPRMRTISIST